MSNKTQYVVGLAFDPHWEKIVLIRKNRPKWQEGKLNGPGGHIELGEDQYEAIVREFREETTIDSKLDDWKHFLTMEGEDFNIDVMTTDTLCIHNAQAVTDEEVIICDVSYVTNPKNPHETIENIPWMILLAIDHLQDGRPAFTTSHYPPGHRGRAVLGTVEALKAEAQRWKGLAELKDAKGEANRTENNNLRANNTILQRQISDLTTERDNALRQYRGVRKTYESMLQSCVYKDREIDDMKARMKEVLQECSILPERLANRLELAMRKGEASSYDELVSLVTEVITHK